MIAKWLWHLKIMDVTGLNPALHENVFWTDFAKISHSELAFSNVELELGLKSTMVLFMCRFNPGLITDFLQLNPRLIRD